MKNNKGFSLVELIIVIAIMAILVGVMAPQLIKYIEKTNVSNDTQVCDTIRTAVQTAMMDPSVITDTTYTDITGGATGTDYTTVTAACNAATTSKFMDSVEDSLGVPSTKTIETFLDEQLKSNNAEAANIHVEINTTSILVYIKDTDAAGKKSSHPAPSTTSDSCIYAGPASTFGL